MLKIENFHAKIDGKPIFKGLSLTVNAGEVHAITESNATDTAHPIVMPGLFRHPGFRVPPL